MSGRKFLLRINDADSVAVALDSLSAGETHEVCGDSVTLSDDIPFGHKVALRDIPAGSDVIKYGYPIGHAAFDIRKGQHVHTHNVRTNLAGVVKYTYNPRTYPLFPARNASFDGYLRPDGSVGVRNEVWIIPTVGCVNNTAKLLEKEAASRFTGMCDGVYAFTHNMGCSQLGDDMLRTQKLLAGLVRHPNAAGVLVLSLGCENNNLDEFKKVLGDADDNRVKFLVTQDSRDEIEDGLSILEQLVDMASAQKRQTVPANKLITGFKCGGSDAFSGITANALCGRVNDIIVSCGGTTMLTEVPEMFGAETILMNRAVNEGVFDDIVRLINGFKGYFTRYNQEIYENPSPGNKKGGITTLEEKSLGCTQKGGQAPVAGVLDYGDRVVPGGLNLLNGPGNDQVSCTNLAAAGCQIILFTTGRGNPFGCPVPTVKLSSNSRLAHNKPNWIDFDAGRLLDGGDFDGLGDELFNYILEVASGRLTRNEMYGYREISVFRDGVIL
ncbi:MAG: altronate dehydratase family protein [Clostridia bacterium]|nr:altronate dehydratase family protein [Clostridia bacterium]